MLHSVRAHTAYASGPPSGHEKRSLATGTYQTNLDEESFSFASVCRRCRQSQPQRGFTRAALQGLLDINFTIYAHCVTCDVQWPISAHERREVASAIRTQHQSQDDGVGDGR